MANLPMSYDVGLGLDRFLECLHFDQIFGEVPSRINVVHFCYDEFLFSKMSFSDCHLYFRNQQGLTAHTHQKHPKDPDSKSDVRCQFCSKIFTCKDLFHQVLFIFLKICFSFCLKIFKQNLSSHNFGMQS